MVKISTVIAVYNVEDYLEDCIQCLLNQTYPVHEIIAVNDGSTDNSGTILDAWAEKSDKIHVIHQENTGGPGGPRNKGIQLATGDTIHFMDPDDKIDEDYYEKMADSIHSFHPHITISNMLKFNSKKKWMPPTFEEVGLFEQNQLTHLYKTPDLIQNMSATNKLFDRRFLLEHDLYFLVGRASEEIDFTGRCLYLAKKVYINKNTTYYWRQRETDDNLSISQQKADFQSVLDRMEGHKNIDQFLEEHRLIEHRYIKDVRAILDFIRHGKKLYEFTPEEQERFFDLVNEYLDTIDQKAYNYLPASARPYYLARLFFLRNRLDYELVACTTTKHGFLPSLTKTKKGTTEVRFDFRYLKDFYEKDPLFSETVSVPSGLVKGKAYLKEGILDLHQMTLTGYGYINYLNVLSKKQIEIDVILSKRGMKEELTFSSTLLPSSEINGVIHHSACKFVAKIPVSEFENWLADQNVIDIRLSITIDGLNKRARLSTLNKGPFSTRLKNETETSEIYITNKGNISIRSI